MSHGLAAAVRSPRHRHDDGGNIAAVTQTNVKRMLAYSSIAHAGYLLIGVVAGTIARRHGDDGLSVRSTRSCSSVRSRSSSCCAAQDVIGDELKDFSGLQLRHPFAAFAMLMFMLSLGGIPPTAGFMGKFWLFGAAIDAGYYLAGGHRRPQQRHLALLLHPHRRLHVSEEGHDRLGAESTSPRWRSRWAWPLSRRSCWASIRGCCSRSRTRSARTLGAAGITAAIRCDRARRRPAKKISLLSFSRRRCCEVFHKIRYTACGRKQASGDNGLAAHGDKDRS